MNIRPIPRNAHETYFIPAGRGRPSRKDVEKYLSANHPLYSKSCEIDSRICTIAGSRFLLVTVLDVPSGKLRGRGIGSRLVTAPAVFASSRYARGACTIRCGDELVVFGPVPESFVQAAAGPETPPADVVIDSGTELIDFMRKEKIRVSLFASRTRIPAFICILLCCAVLPSFIGMPRPDPAPIRGQLVMGNIPAIASVPFREIFAAEIDAIYAGGAVIEDYRFDLRAKPETRIRLKKGDPNIVLRELRRIDSIGSVTADGLRYADGTARYQVDHTVEIPFGGRGPADGIPAVFAVIESLEGLSAAHAWKLSVAASDDPVFGITVPEPEFPRFPGLLFSWCTEKNLIVTALHAAKNGEASLFNVTLRLERSPGECGVAALDPGKIKSVFGIAETIRPPGKKAETANRSALIGRIGDSSAGVFVFGRTASGKIHVDKEQAR